MGVKMYMMSPIGPHSTYNSLQGVDPSTGVLAYAESETSHIWHIKEETWKAHSLQSKLQAKNVLALYYDNKLDFLFST